MRRLMWFGAILLVCLLSSPLIMAYDDAQDATLAEMQALLDELSEAIYRAEVGRSAHPAFLEHLRDLEMGLQDLLSRLRTKRDEPAEWGATFVPKMPSRSWSCSGCWGHPVPGRGSVGDGSGHPDPGHRP